MNRIKSAAMALYLAIAALGLAAAPAQAAVIYSYTGNVFNSFSMSSPWDASNSVTGSFTVDTAIEASAIFIDATSRAGFGFSFTDGVNSYTSPGTVVNNFRISTGPTGDITAWTIDLKLGLEQLITKNDQNFVTDIGLTAGGAQFAGNQNNAGSWSVPEPASLALLGLGLVGLGLARRRKAA